MCSFIPLKGRLAQNCSASWFFSRQNHLWSEFTKKESIYRSVLCSFCMPASDSTQTKPCSGSAEGLLLLNGGCSSPLSLHACMSPVNQWPDTISFFSFIDVSSYLTELSVKFLDMIYALIRCFINELNLI